MRFLTVITMLILAMALVQPVAAQSFNAGNQAYMKQDYATDSA
jgi:hypothetical protein